MSSKGTLNPYEQFKSDGPSTLSIEQQPIFIADAAYFISQRALPVIT
jgi:hypothetical protein